MPVRRRVLLVNPRMCSPRSVRLPLSLLALASVLEGRHDYDIVDGNVTPDAGTLVPRLAREADLVAMTVMPGPQVGPAVAIASALRRAHPSVPIVWGGYFPTLYPDAAVNADYVDYAVRGQGEDTLLELLEALPAPAPHEVRGIRGLTWKRDGHAVHNPERPFRSPDAYPAYPYERLSNVAHYLRPSFLGSKTAVHQAAIGCRYRCSFCGVVSMFDGRTEHQSVDRLAAALATLRDRYGANAVQFYDHNFFDREESSIPVLETLARFRMPWWCYARTDTLANFSGRTWKLLATSGLKMTYVGAEAGSDAVLRSMHKGTKVRQTIEVAKLGKAHGVIPEFSFVLGGPEDPEGEIERTFELVRRLKRVNPDCEIILYFYSPTPQRDRAAVRAGPPGTVRPTLDTYGPGGPPLPRTPEGWAEGRWVDYACHRDAPWLTDRIRQRVRDFAQVLACRFPTAQDVTTPGWGKSALRNLARWRYATRRYRHPVELRLARRLIPLRDPQRESL